MLVLFRSYPRMVTGVSNDTPVSKPIRFFVLLYSRLLHCPSNTHFSAFPHRAFSQSIRTSRSFFFFLNSTPVDLYHWELALNCVRRSRRSLTVLCRYIYTSAHLRSAPHTTFLTTPSDLDICTNSEPHSHHEAILSSIIRTTTDAHLHIPYNHQRSIYHISRNIAPNRISYIKLTNLDNIHGWAIQYLSLH